jgi:hypothetical protein
MMLGTFPFELIVTPELVVVVSEQASGIRHIYTDGRGHGPAGKRSNTGDSVGRWEGDALVVETTGMAASGTVVMGLPHSDQLRVTERFRKTAPDALEYTVTVEDPKVLTRPATGVRTFEHHADVKITEFVCQGAFSGSSFTF